jgi:hypothetical protein
MNAEKTKNPIGVARNMAYIRKCGYRGGVLVPYFNLGEPLPFWLLAGFL